MQSDNAQLVRLTTGFAVIVAVVPPIAFFYHAVLHATTELDADAELRANVITQLIGRNPLLWHYEAHRIEEILARSHQHEHAVKFRVLDAAGEVVVEYRANRSVGLESPVMHRAVPLFDSGRVVGQVQIFRSSRPLLLDTGLVGVLSLALAIVIFFVLRTLPLRALSRA